MSEDLTLRLVLETDQAEKDVAEFAEKASKDIEQATKASHKAAEGIRAAVGKVQGIGDAIGAANDKLENIGTSMVDATKSAVRLVAAVKLIKAASVSAGTAALGGVGLLAKKVPGAEQALAGVGQRLRDITATSPRLAFVGRAVDGVAGAAQDGEVAFLKLNKRATLFGRIAIFAKNNKAALLNFAKAALAAGAAVAVMVAAFAAMAKIAEVAQQRIDTLGAARIWKTSASEAEAYRRSLNDVKTGLEALATVTELRQIGFSQEDVQRLAYMVNIIAAVTGEAKEAVEQRLKGAQVTERDLGVFTRLTGELKTQQGVQNAIDQAKIKAGGATLTLAVRSQAVSQYLAGSAKAAAQLERNLGKVGAANPFTVFKKQLRTIREDIVTYIAPSILKAFQKVAWVIRQVGEGWARVAVIAKNGWTEGRKILTEMRRQEAETAKRNAAQLGALNKKTQAQEQQAHTKTLARLRQQKAKQEALAETLGRMQRARNLARNFEREALTRIAAFGARGISQTIAGISQLVELSKVLGQNFTGSSKSAQLLRLQLQAGTVAAKKLAINESIQTASLAANLALSKSIRAEVQARAQLQDIEGSLAGGVKSVNEAIKVLKGSQNEMAKRGIGMLRKTLALLKKEGDERKRIANLTLARARAEEAFDKASKELAAQSKLNGLLEQQRGLRQKIARLSGQTVRDRGAAVEATIDKTAIEIQQANALISKYIQFKKTVIDARDAARLDKQIQRQRVVVTELKKRLALEEQLRAMQVRADKLADERRAKQVSDAARSAKARQADLTAQLVGLRNQNAGGQGSTATEGALAKTRQQVQQLAADMASLGRQLKLLDPSSAAAVAIQQTLSAKAKELDLTRAIAAEQELMVRREHERLTVIGSLVAVMQDQVKGLARRVGKQIATQITSVAQGMVNAIGAMFTDLITAPANALDNLGKNILSAFGDIAFQLAAFFAAEAIGMAFTPGGQAAAVGLGVAAASLAAIGGTLKGVAAAIAAPPKPASSSGSGAGGTGPRTGLPGAAPSEPEKSETYILVTNAIFGSEEEQVRHLKRILDRNKRALGGRAI